MFAAQEGVTMKPGGATYFEQYQEKLRNRTWSWADVPFRGSGGYRNDVARLHDLDYLDVYQGTFGRSIGANGIGRLREVGLVDVDAIGEEPSPGRGSGRNGGEHQKRRSYEQERYAQTLREHGVTVHSIVHDDTTAVASRPAVRTRGTPRCALLVLNGGCIVPKTEPGLGVGWAERQSEWAFWTLNIPTLLTIHGRGVCDAASTVWLAQDVYVVGNSRSYDADGVEQLLRVVRLTAGVEELEVLTVRPPGRAIFDEESGVSSRISQILAPLDVKKALCHPPSVDASTLIWLQRHGYAIIEVEPEEQVRYRACNLVLLEPGRVLMAEDATRTIERVRAAGVDVVEVPFGEWAALGRGLRDQTLELRRDIGPCA
jgi:hypothetical protein